MHAWHNTVENPHPATLPSVQLLPFLNGPLLLRPTLAAPGWGRESTKIEFNISLLTALMVKVKDEWCEIPTDGYLSKMTCTTLIWLWGKCWSSHGLPRRHGNILFWVNTYAKQSRCRPSDTGFQHNPTCTKSVEMKSAHLLQFHNESFFLSFFFLSIALHLTCVPYIYNNVAQFLMDVIIIQGNAQSHVQECPQEFQLAIGLLIRSLATWKAYKLSV